MALRIFRSADLPAVHRLVCSTIDACYPPFYRPGAVTFFKRHHSPAAIAARATDNLVLVFELDAAAIVGTGSLSGDEISGVFVSPDVQGNGIGAALMNELERSAMARGISTVELDVSLPSRGFYERLGYSMVDECSLDVGNGERLDYWRASKELDDRF